MNKNTRLIIGLCCLIIASVGLTTNIAGVFFDAVMKDLQVSRAAISLTLTISNLLFSYGGIVAGKFLNERNVRKVSFVSVLAILSSTIILAYAHDLFLHYCMHAIRGFFTGLYGTVMATILIRENIKTNVAFTTSIVLGFSGIAGAVFSPFFSKLIDNIGWQKTYMVSALCMLVLYLPIMMTPLSFSSDKKEESSETGQEEKSNEKTSSAHVWTITLFASMGGF